jgi:hypothetical protein
VLLVDTDLRKPRVTLVVRAGSTDRATAKHALEQLRNVNANVIGVGLNDPDGNVPKYSSYDYYYQYYGADETQPAQAGTVGNLRSGGAEGEPGGVASLPHPPLRRCRNPHAPPAAAGARQGESGRRRSGRDLASHGRSGRIAAPPKSQTTRCRCRQRCRNRPGHSAARHTLSIAPRSGSWITAA